MLFRSAAGPFCLLFGQNYGGEAVLRVLLFSLPWCAALIAWALATIERPLRRAVAALAVCGVAAALFVPAFFGQEELNQIPTSEVQASDYFYAHAQAGSVMLFSAPNFPGDYGPRYPLIRGTGSADPPTLLYSNRFRNRQLGSGDVPAVVASIRHYSPRGYIVFSTSQTEYAHVFQQFGKPGLQAALSRGGLAAPRPCAALPHRAATIATARPTRHSYKTAPAHAVRAARPSPAGTR